MILHKIRKTLYGEDLWMRYITKTSERDLERGRTPTSTTKKATTALKLKRKQRVRLVHPYVTHTQARFDQIMEENRALRDSYGEHITNQQNIEIAEITQRKIDALMHGGSS